MMKKWILGFTGLAVAVLLAGCSSSTVASMKGDKITQKEYYDALKKSSAGQQELRTLIVSKALEQQYGDKVSSAKVKKQFNAMKAQYGSTFDSTLSQNGYTESSFKDQIRTSMLSEVALKDLKKPTTKQIKKQYKSYEPKIEVQHILVKTKLRPRRLFPSLRVTTPPLTSASWQRRTQPIPAPRTTKVRLVHPLTTPTHSSTAPSRPLPSSSSRVNTPQPQLRLHTVTTSSVQSRTLVRAA